VCNLKEINNAVNRPGMNCVRRVNIPLEIDDDFGELMAPHVGDPVYEREADELWSETSHLKYPNCDGVTYLDKDNASYCWLCFNCGTKSEANLEDAKKLLFIEKYID
jgi:hypothetical protein